MAQITHDMRHAAGIHSPYRKRQLVCTVVFLLDAFAFGLSVGPLLEKAELWGLAAAFVFVLLALVATALPTVYINPADIGIRSGSSKDTEQMMYCYQCQSYMRPKSKHCWNCKKCIAGFDHHCLWVDHCIGERNYGYFFATIFLATVLFGLVVASLAFMLDRQLNSAEAPRPLRIVSLMTVLVLNLPLWLLVMLALGFNCFLCATGSTTYEYLTGREPAPPSGSGSSIEPRSLGKSFKNGPWARSLRGSVGNKGTFSQGSDTFGIQASDDQSPEGTSTAASAVIPSESDT